MNTFAPKRRVLIVGEGRETEYNYFVGFRTAFETELEATATSVSVRRGKGGSARGIVENAIKETDLHNLRLTGVARRTNPSTQVYELIAILSGARTGEKCPLTGTWRLIGDASVTNQFSKGDKMPPHNDLARNWEFLSR